MLTKIFLALSSGQIQTVADPVIELCNAILPVLIAVVGAVGTLWCVLLGVRYAKADDPQEHEKAKKGLANAVVGFVLIFVLLIAVKVGIYVFGEWFSNYNFPTLD